MKYKDILRAQERHEALEKKLAAVVNLQKDTWSDMKRGLDEEVARIRKEMDELEV